MVKVNVKTNMSYMLEKPLVENLMSLEYEYLNRMLLDLGPKQVLVIISIHVSSRMPTGTSCLMIWKLSHIKMTRQTDSEQLDISFIYHWV
jgi:hypothetical protein